MLIKIPMKKGEKKRRFTQFDPTDQQSTSILSVLYPHTEWLPTLPFDTSEFTLFISDAPLGDEAVVTLPPVPYAEPAGNYTRFEIHDDKGNRIGTSMDYPVTQLLLQNSELDPEIIDEKKPIYLGVSAATPLVIVDGPEAFGIDEDDSDIGEDDGDGDDPDENEVDVITDGPSHQQLATKFLSFFLQHYVSFFRGSRLTSRQIEAAIKANAPDGVRIDLIDRKTIVLAFRSHYGIGMEKHSARFDGDPEKYWQDFCVRVHRPDPLERQWYDQTVS